MMHDGDFFADFILFNCYTNSNSFFLLFFFFRLLFNVLFYVDLSFSLLRYIVQQSHAAFSVQRKKTKKNEKNQLLKIFSLRCILLQNQLSMFSDNSLSNLYLSVHQGEEKHECYCSNKVVSSSCATHNVFSNINNSNFRTLNNCMA